MSPFFAMQVPPSDVPVEAVTPAEFDRHVMASAGKGSATPMLLGFEGVEAVAGYPVYDTAPISFILPAGYSLWVKNPNSGGPSYFLISRSPV